MADFKVGDRVRIVVTDHVNKHVNRVGEIVSMVSEDIASVAIDDSDEVIFMHCKYLQREQDADHIAKPPHYTAHPSGVECIDVAEHFSFCLGNVVKYVWRAGLKGDALEDLKKAKWCLEREIANREKAKS